VPFCKGVDYVIRKGYRYNKSGIKQIWHCNKCSRKFTPDNGFWKMKNTPETVTEALDLYEQGFSLEETSEHLWKHHAIKISPTATAYENLAQIYLLTQKPNDTLEFLKEAIVAFPNSPNLNKFIALSLFAVNATEEAKMYAQKSVMLNSSTENINLLQQILK